MCPGPLPVVLQGSSQVVLGSAGQPSQPNPRTVAPLVSGSPTQPYSVDAHTCLRTTLMVTPRGTCVHCQPPTGRLAAWPRTPTAAHTTPRAHHREQRLLRVEAYCRRVQAPDQRRGRGLSSGGKGTRECVGPVRPRCSWVLLGSCGRDRSIHHHRRRVCVGLGGGSTTLTGTMAVQSMAWLGCSFSSAGPSSLPPPGAGPGATTISPHALYSVRVHVWWMPWRGLLEQLHGTSSPIGCERGATRCWP